ncbi:MAG: MBL fold metallo-hydrolase [Planctomycetota bacterium]
MIPKPPPREGSLGFLFLPPYRVQGVSVAGEQTVIQVPELDTCFDMGTCPRAVLPAKDVAITHGHMDHIGGLGYFCSQRNFQGMGPAKIVCHQGLAPAIDKMMAGFQELEGQTTPYELIPLAPEGEVEIKNSIWMRMFETEHTQHSAGYAIVEKRSKLRDEFAGLPQEKLRELRDKGEDITRIQEVPLVSFLGDLSPGAPMVRPDVLQSQIVICECTFVEKDHKSRAEAGNHLHLKDIAEWLGVLQCEHLVLVHVSRRSNIAVARKNLRELVTKEQFQKVHFLMDYRTNKERYDRQAEEAERAERARARA